MFYATMLDKDAVKSSKHMYDQLVCFYDSKMLDTILDSTC